MPKSPCSQRDVYPAQLKPSNKNTFVYTLFSILSGSRFDCLRWSADGLSVVIDGAEEVGSQVLSQYFQTEKISSFIRQFHLYGFKRTTDGRKNKNKRGYSNWVNRYFQRGRPDLLELITRLPPPKSPLKDKSEDNEDDDEEGRSNYKSGAYMSRLRLPMTDPRAPSTYPGLNLNVNVQPNVLLPDNQGIVASPVIVAYSQQPVLAAASSLSPALSAVIESPVSPFAPPPLRPLQQSTFPVDREINQSVFETPRAVETLYALQTIEDNVDGVHPEVLAFMRGQLDKICESIDSIRDRSLRGKRSVQDAPPPIAVSIRTDVSLNMQPPNMHLSEISAPRSAPGLPPANALLPFGSTSQSFSLPSSSDRMPHLSCSLSQRGSSFHLPTPLITTPDNMSHLLAHQGVLPGDQQEYIGNIAVGPKMSPLTPFPIGTSDMFSTIHTQQFGSNPIAMTADMYCAAPKSTGYHVTTAGSNMADIEMACSPRATDMPPHLGGFSVADIYFQPTSPFGNCPGVLDAAVGAPTPLFMNDGTYNVKSGSTAMDISTSMPNPPFNSTPGFQHKPFM